MTEHSKGIENGLVDRRKYSRINAPYLHVFVGKREFIAISWSMGGCILEAYDGELTPGALFDIYRLGAESGAEVDLLVRARVLRREKETGRLALTFHDVDNRAYAFMQELMAGNLSE
ncbi:MAG: hypothetical protein OQK07_09795 [Rhodospirillales bacterium]|nr:hypothetical protein [Rhodospirillales bacterium]